MSSRNELNSKSDTELPIAVILAPGRRNRLRSEHSGVPKPLVRLRGLSLAERSIAQMLAVNVDEFVVVLGSDADRVRSEFERVARRRRCRIDFVVAEDWRVCGPENHFLRVPG